MQKSIFSVYDSKSGVFSTPFTSVNQQTALRDFQRAASDPASDLHNFPTDYTLFQLAIFDDVTGKITTDEVLVNLGMASQFNNPEV